LGRGKEAAVKGSASSFGGGDSKGGERKMMSLEGRSLACAPGGLRLQRDDRGVQQRRRQVGRQLGLHVLARGAERSDDGRRERRLGQARKGDVHQAAHAGGVLQRRAARLAHLRRRSRQHVQRRAVQRGVAVRKHVHRGADAGGRVGARHLGPQLLRHLLLALGRRRARRGPRRRLALLRRRRRRRRGRHRLQQRPHRAVAGRHQLRAGLAARRRRHLRGGDPLGAARRGARIGVGLLQRCVLSGGRGRFEG